MALVELEPLIADLTAGIERAGDRGGRTLVSATVPVEEADPCAVAFTSRLAREPWFCWEQPDRGFALGAIGSAASSVSRGSGRFGDVAADCASLSSAALVSGAEGLPAGTGPVWTGGFAFAPDGGSEAQWASFEPATMTLPEISLCRTGGQAWLTANVVAGPGIDAEERLAGLAGRIASLRGGSLPMLAPVRSGRTEIRSTRPPSEFESAVAEATRRIAGGGLSKVVLAREVVATAPAAHDVAALFGAQRELFPSCFSFCCGTAQGAFVGASPELLLRRSGASLSTVALAGSTRRSSDPAVDDHLGEQLLRSAKDRREHEIVARRIVRSLRRLAVWVQADPDPGLVKVANIQHLATPVVAQLAEPRSAVELAGLLHPTPAVGGEPWPQAGEAIEDLEQMDRGWYAGPVGWMDATEDGEFCVALRSALIRDREARLFAGGGIVEASDPAAELAETEVKLGALLPLLAE
ncbi:MAG TPA: isochorismate synthase [Solirubrobacterales bacterium]|nr:isochorismate synthase [Solirubrobacterales bacterium]